MRRPLLLIVLFGLVSTVGCSNDSADINGEWRLVEGTLDGVEILSPPPAPGDMTESIRSVLLVVDDGYIEGRGPCNRYGGPMEITVRNWARSEPFEFDVEYSEAFAELMGCSEETNRAEGDYFDALFGTERGSRNGDVLTLIGDGIELEFDLIGDPPTP